MSVGAKIVKGPVPSKTLLRPAAAVTNAHQTYTHTSRGQRLLANVRLVLTHAPFPCCRATGVHAIHPRTVDAQDEGGQLRDELRDLVQVQVGRSVAGRQHTVDGVDDAIGGLLVAVEDARAVRANVQEEALVLWAEVVDVH